MKKLITALVILILSIVMASAVYAEGCQVVEGGGVPGCGLVSSWGSTNIVSKVKQAAENNPGTGYMGWCPRDDATPYAVVEKDACNCPNLQPAPGQCLSATCGSCGNPFTICAPEPEPYCGDGEINQPSEQCEFDSQCNDGNSGTRDSCNACKCVNTPTCTDECVSGELICSGDNLKVCGNFDSDSCTEWGFKKDCSYTKTSEYDLCINEDSVRYRDVEKGFCKVASGNDYCDSYTYTEKVKTTDCGETTCSGDTYCKDDDVYSSTECTVRGCKESTGACYTDTTREAEKVDECGSDSSSEFCNGEYIVEETTDRGCKDNGSAYCYEEKSTKNIESCGSDICIEHTDKDVFVQEFVHDEESCVEQEYPFCAYDPGDIYDYCLNSDILMQAICIGNDHSFEQYDCSKKDGCYEFTYEKCKYCEDSQGLCNGRKCTATGMEYRNYFCGNGSCMYDVSQMQDIDKDMFDDRCDDCIDVDKDGACDDVDTCPGVSNPTQVDSDNDGKGNACDEDRDGDGYNGDVDCDDWNKEVHPNAYEVKNNERDDDCNPETDDKGVYTARQALFVELDYDEAAADKTFEIKVEVTNNNAQEMKDLKVTVDLGSMEKRTELIKTIESGETEVRFFDIPVPEQGFTSLRVNVGNDYYKRVIYREVKLN